MRRMDGSTQLAEVAVDAFPRSPGRTKRRLATRDCLIWKRPWDSEARSICGSLTSSTTFKSLSSLASTPFIVSVTIARPTNFAMSRFLVTSDAGTHISIPVGITIGLLASFVQSLGLTIQRKSHVQNQLLPEPERKVEHRRP